MRKLARESVVLGAICLVDLLTTLWFLSGGDAAEGNPVMGMYLDHGICAFIGAKVLLVVGPIAIMEWARRRNPVYVRRMLRCTIAMYIALYGTGVWRLNSQVAASAQLLAQSDRTVRWAALPPSPSEMSVLRQRIRAASAKLD